MKPLQLVTYLGPKYKLGIGADNILMSIIRQLNNTVGIIDSDYYGSDNEGHIFIKITNDSNEGKTLSLKKGDGFAQGVFLPYGVTSDDEAAALRNGGFGSTG